MAEIVIADAGSLIALAKVNLLAVLAQLFGSVVMPETVQQECLAKAGEENQRIQHAIEIGMIRIATPAQTDLALALSRSLVTIRMSWQRSWVMS